jgi:hypothetical protein
LQTEFPPTTYFLGPFCPPTKLHSTHNATIPFRLVLFLFSPCPSSATVRGDRVRPAALQRFFALSGPFGLGPGYAGWVLPRYWFGSRKTARREGRTGQSHLNRIDSFPSSFFSPTSNPYREFHRFKYTHIGCIITKVPPK